MLDRRFTAIASGALELFICDSSVHPLLLLPRKDTDGTEQQGVWGPRGTLLGPIDRAEEGAAKFEARHPQSAKNPVLEKNWAMQYLQGSVLACAP